MMYNAVKGNYVALGPFMLRHATTGGKVHFVRVRRGTDRDARNVQ